MGQPALLWLGCHLSPSPPLLASRQVTALQLRSLWPYKEEKILTPWLKCLPGAFVGEYKGQEHIHRHVADCRLLAIPASRGRVAALDPNWDRLLGISSPLRVRNPLYRPLYHVCSPGRKSHADLASSPPSSGVSPAVPRDTCNTGRGLRSLPHLREHLRARADDNHAAPVLVSLWRPHLSVGFHQHVKPW